MGGIRQNIDVHGRGCWALFDSGARNTYVVSKIAASLPTFDLKISEPVKLGGKEHYVDRNCWLDCTIEGLPVRGHGRVLEEIGNEEDGKEIEILIGALTMQEWGIRLIPDEEKLDLSHYPKEFVEF